MAFDQHNPVNVRRLQRTLNGFFAKYLDGYTALQVDGVWGKHTEQRLLSAKFFLGFDRARSVAVPDVLYAQLLDPNSLKLFPAKEIAAGKFRRNRHDANWAKSQRAAARGGGLVQMDNHYVVAWIAHIAENVRAGIDVHGNRTGVAHWTGEIVSGYRTPKYSEHLCYIMCNAPRCPGRCAGIYTNHARKGYHEGAIDVSDYVTFRSELERLGYWGELHNALPNDPVHFSYAGN